MILGTFKRGEGEEVRVSIGEYKDKKYLDIRYYFEMNGEMKPTKKGITIRPRELPEFIEMVTRADDILSGRIEAGGEPF